MTAYAANLRALAALADAHSDRPDPAMRNYTGWTDPRTRADAFDAVGTPQPSILDAYARLSLRPDFTHDLHRLHLPPCVARSVTALACRALGRAPVSVLAPFAGDGVFLDALAEHMQATEVVGQVSWRLVTEPDPVRAAILRHLHPSWEVRQAPLHTAGIAAPWFDLVIGCAPTDGPIMADDLQPELRWAHLRAHPSDYHLCKAVASLLPSGVCAMVVHHNTLDRPERGAREWLTEHTVTLGVWRLPIELWAGQGERPLTDLVLLKRRP